MSDVPQNSFIANINRLAANLNTIISANDIFDEDVIPILKEIADLDLQEVTADLLKGSYLGNRKIDINLLHNMVGIDANTSDEDALAIWVDATKTVRYDKATITFIDGSTYVMNFTFDGNPTTVSTHADLLLQFNNSTAFLARLDNTLVNAFAAPIVGEFIRFHDVIGKVSNVAKITLNAISGSFIDKTPAYYWVATTSVLHILATRADDLIQLGNSMTNMLLLSNNLEKLLSLQARIPQLIDTYTNGVPNGDVTIYNSLTQLLSIFNNLQELLKVESYALQANASAILAGNYAKLAQEAIATKATPTIRGTVYTSTAAQITDGTVDHVVDASQMKQQFAEKVQVAGTTTAGIIKKATWNDVVNGVGDGAITPQTMGAIPGIGSGGIGGDSDHSIIHGRTSDGLFYKVTEFKDDTRIFECFGTLTAATAAVVRVMFPASAIDGTKVVVTGNHITASTGIQVRASTNTYTDFVDVGLWNGSTWVAGTFTVNIIAELGAGLLPPVPTGIYINSPSSGTIIINQE